VYMMEFILRAMYDMESLLATIKPTSELVKVEFPYEVRARIRKA